MLRKNFLYLIALCVCIIIGATTSAYAAAQIQSGIEQILRRFDPNLDIGIQVQSLYGSQTLYQKNAGQLFMPASTMKIVTAAAALSYLGPDFRFQTKVLTKSPTIAQGTLNSDVYFYFDGDPSLQRTDINELIAVLKQRGINSITGNIYIDDYAFDQKIFGPGWMWDERNFCYASPTSAISIEKNCFPLQIIAPPTEAARARVSTTKAYSFMRVYNGIIGRRGSFENCPLDLRASGDNDYYLFGCMHPKSPTIKFSVAVRNVRSLAKNIILQQLQSNNISFNGQIKFAPTPTNVTLSVLAYHNSAPLSALITKMLKKSDNLIADAVFKKIGNAYYHTTATWKNSAKAVAAILGPKTGIDFRKMKMVDGSGLSRYNLISPAQLNAILRFAFNDPQIREPFYRALPSSGKDGTLAYRLGNLPGRIHAKTGNMANISSLAGYVVTNSHQVLAFAIVLNDFLSKPHVYHKLQDMICAYLAKF